MIWAPWRASWASQMSRRKQFATPPRRLVFCKDFSRALRWRKTFSYSDFTAARRGRKLEPARLSRNVTSAGSPLISSRSSGAKTTVRTIPSSPWPRVCAVDARTIGLSRGDFLPRRSSVNLPCVPSRARVLALSPRARRRRQRDVTRAWRGSRLPQPGSFCSCPFSSTNGDDPRFEREDYLAIRTEVVKRQI